MRDNVKNKVLDKVKAAVQDHELFKNVKKAIIAFSSGPDSVCLLDCLMKLYGDRINFTIVYINHGMRPAEILKKEEELTKKYAVKYKIRCRIFKLKMTKTKFGIEATARKERYKVLLKYLQRSRCQVIALGHNLDDVIETFFMNLIRGSGARGMRSIPIKRLPYVRPLINIRKSQILEYLRHKRLVYSKDLSNESLDYRRNLLRHKIIPRLLEINPDLHQTILRTIKILKEDDDLLEEKADNAYKNVAQRKTNQVLLDIQKILKYNPAVQNRVIMKAVKALRAALDGFESKHITQILGLKDKESGKKISLPKKLYAQKEFNKILIGIIKPLSRINIKVNPDNDFLIIKDRVIKFKTVKKYNLKAKKDYCEVFDMAGIELPLLIRNKKDGDVIETRIGRKKVKKIFQERKIPVHQRKDAMVLCDQKGILWVIGIVRSSRAFIKKTTTKIMVVDSADSN
jgi:tRNA(Ile)-lysidine synthase